ncbi:3-ketosteroid 9alpha-monooxygenase subunit B [Crossiella equi]|uniref:3-ketosteroid 9alpha-monooxygenase subunit B n=1 Tax=Crossiella equi TaxID=130796 RepID=A0ABS5ANG7_9PSEU|nr:2Fe-2S iron-sulfur cluster-binding protein [Crossiella equi]MBP2478085.1 3-ketosteroid 9alpha-monooxygenase subunit B [Crossiella equi]
MAEFHALRVAEVVRETPDAVSLVFEVPPGLRDTFTHEPGQFLTIRVPCGARSYSLCNGPDEPPRVAVKRIPEGRASIWVCDTVVPGTVLDVLPPAGTFTPPSLAEDLALFAAGSGITPVLSIVKAVLARGSGDLFLFYANRDERSVIFAEELRALVAAHPGRLRVVHWLESVQGLPSAATLRPFLTGRRTFLCGPAPFMAAVREAAPAPDLLHTEVFRSLTDDPFSAPAPAADPDAAVVEVDLDGEQHTLPWPRGRKLLDVLLGHGLAAPYSCREGACSACACRLVDGKVTLAHNEVLDEDDLTDGIILACQALPAADTVRITYE